MPRLSKIGAAALAAFGWTGLQTVTADFLVVAGGGGGATAFGAGGGAGGYRTSAGPSGGGASAEAKLTLNTTQSYTVTIGAGGAGGTGSGDGANGTNSVFSTITSTGGGRGGWNGGAGSSGGSGGAGGNQGGTSSAAGAGTANQGFAGGTGSGSPSYGSGGGGGAGAAGSNGTTSTCGDGGVGVASSISGTSTYYAGGGGGGATAAFGITTPGNGGNGGGGKGSDSTNSWVGYSGEANKGGGGGGGGYTSGGVWQAGGQGGSGVVIISYAGAQQFGGGVVTSVGGNTIHTFTTSGTLSPLSSLTASYLIVAGGGAGARHSGAAGGGGGAGGLLSGSGLTIDTNSIYVVSVGGGGIIGADLAAGGDGSPSSFSAVSTSAVGGGGGGAQNSNGRTGGSGGGGTYLAGVGGSGTSGQGNNGGATTGASGGGGGGGASAVGSNSSGTTGGNGGNGSASSISGSSVSYAGGGGGGTNGGTPGSGGTGGGGTGANASGGNATSGTTNLGGGGGGAGYLGGTAGAGGSGIVIISYPGSTPQMAGGTVTAAGGNIIHTFTSSGYLTPITNLNNSLRFRNTITGSPSSPAYLSRTFTTAGNQQKWTFSVWLKKTLGRQTVFGRGSTQFGSMQFESNDTLSLNWASGGTTYFATTTQVFRDPSAWYHLVWAIDTTQSVASARQRLYVNGSEVTAWSSYVDIPQNTSGNINTANSHWIGRFWESGFEYPFSGYMTEINFIDGQQLTANSFGAFNGQGVWQPIRYGGSYGTNGFYLPFTNTTSTTTLGYDFSPNGNNWTTNNISLTAGSTYDSMTDVPTNTSATVANYCVMNPLTTGSLTTLSGANLNLVQTSGSSVGNSRSSFAMLTGKWYFETTLTANSLGIYPQLGIMTARDGSRPNNDYPQAGYATSSLDPTLSVIYMADGTKQTNGSASAYGSSFTNGDVIGIAIDSDNGAIYFGKQTGGTGSMVWQNSGVPTSGASKTGAALTWTGGTVDHVYSVAGYGNLSQSVNFGQRPFSATPPTGFVALNTFNLPTPTIGATPATTANNYFNAVLYSGNNSTQTITTGFQPDFIWSKCRNVGRSHRLIDSVRGLSYQLFSDSTAGGSTYDATSYVSSITSTSSSGFSITNAGTDQYNTSGENYVSWAWKANGSGSTNTAGSIISTVSSNTTAGFSIVTYTGNGTNSTVGHGLLVGGVATAPSMVIVKSRSTAQRWTVYTAALGNGYYGYLNETFAFDTANASLRWNTAPTSSVFGVGTSVDVNGNTTTYVAYCFAQVAGYSAFGSYTGNGSSDGPFIYTGFRPKYLLIFNITTGTGEWLIQDSVRDPYNYVQYKLAANRFVVENDATYIGTSTQNTFDFLSNGFKARTSNGNSNGSSNTYIYMAFAESPFKYANAR